MKPLIKAATTGSMFLASGALCAPAVPEHMTRSGDRLVLDAQKMIDGGTVRDNVVRRVNLRGGRETGNKVGLSVPFAITVMNSRNVTVKDNRVSDLGPHAEATVGDLGDYPKP